MNPKPTLSLIDTGISNTRSVATAFRRLGCSIQLTNEPEEICRSDGIILPGVGSFGDGMKALKKHKLDHAISKAVLEHSTPILGICLGMQLLASESSEHGKHTGLGLLTGKVDKLTPSSDSVRVPNIGWYSLKIKKDTLFSGLPSDADAYFVHSYHWVGHADVVAASIEFGGEEVIAAVESDRIFGLQFHPEKSQDVGLQILHNFMGFVTREFSSKSKYLCGKNG